MKTRLRLLVVVPLALAAMLLPSTVAQSAAPTHCVLQGASLGGSNADLDGFVGTNYQYDAPVGVNSVSGETAVRGYPRWFPIAIDNDSPTSVASPTITISSGLDSSAFGGTLPTPGLPSSCSQPSLGPNQEMQLFPGQNSGDWLSAPGEPAGFDPGFDSTRTVTPSAVPVGGGDVTVRFAVTITDDSRFSSGQTIVGVNLNGPNPNPAGTIVSLSDPTNLDQGEMVQENSWNTWVLQNAQVHKTYVFTAVVHVDNPLNGQAEQAGPWTWVPQAEITVTKPGGCGPCGEVTGSSVRVPEPDLDGSTPGSGAITLSVGDGTHSWNVGRQTSWIVTYPGGLFPDVYASETSAIGSRVSADVDSVASGATLNGQRNWFALGIGTGPGGPQFTSPTVSVVSGYDPSLLDPGFGQPATGYPIVFSGNDVLSSNNGGAGIGSSIDASFSSPCDISRTVSPLTVPVGGGQQTVSLSISCTGMENINIGLGIDVPGAQAVSFTPPGNLSSEQLFAPGGFPQDGGSEFGIGEVISGKTYTASWVIQVPNPYGVPFADKPDLKYVVAHTLSGGCFGCSGSRTSVTVAEPTLDGPTPGAGQITFSAGEAHIWAVSVQTGYEINLGATRPGNLYYLGPGSAGDGTHVTLSAFWGGSGCCGLAEAGTPVTFTLGSQSCTGATGSVTNASNGDTGASCTITLAQPVGSYTLDISSPGDVTVFPTTTSAPLSITGPARADQCKNGGWKIFGIFKNQGDCVSYVATGGKNPPSSP